MDVYFFNLKVIHINSPKDLVMNTNKSLFSKFFHVKIFLKDFIRSYNYTKPSFSLLLSLHKIINKVPADNHICEVLPNTISPTQGDLVKGTQVIDAVLMANEILDQKRHYDEEEMVRKMILRWPIFILNGIFQIMSQYLNVLVGNGVTR